MGLTRVVVRGCAFALASAATVAHAGTVTFDNGITGVGHVDVTLDDFGSWGRWVGPNSADNYQPPNYPRPDPLTNVGAVYLFPAVAGHTGGVELSGYKILHNLVTGANSNGIAGDYAALSRTLTTPIALTGGVAHSAFTISDSATGLKLDILQDAKLITEAFPATLLEQVYTINNSGPDGVIINFHAIWDMNVLYSSSSANDDIVGVPPGLCYMYMRDPGSSSAFGGALADGGSGLGVPGALAPMKPTAYYGAKENVLPEGNLQPPFAVATTNFQPVWTSFKMPATWINELAGGTKNTPGETATVAPAMVAYEYQFLLNAGGQARIVLHRHYGLITLPCTNVGVNCGNGMVDSGEACDSSVDTAQCDANLCTAPSCGDNHVNSAAGETCESNGIDTADCNGAFGGPCTAPACGDGYLNPAAGEACDDGANTANCNLTNCQPPACGDGVVNEAAGEDCDGDSLCSAECKWAFSLGGGCAGCSSSGDGAGSLLLAGVVAFTWRRRRRARSTRGDSDCSCDV